jgi:RNA polymerase sigma-70 factor (ECF subfamily)
VYKRDTISPGGDIAPGESFIETSTDHPQDRVAPHRVIGFLCVMPILCPLLVGKTQVWVMSCSDPVPEGTAGRSALERVLAEVPSVYGWIARLRVPDQDIADLCQDVLVAALKTLHTFDVRADVRGWLYAIVRRVVAQYHARCRRLPRVTVGEADDFSDLAACSPSPEEMMERRELIDVLTAKIPPSRREIFLAHRLDGLTFEEIGEVFEITPEAARKRDSRAMKDFEAAWEEHQAKQHRLGAFVLPISAKALLEAERARYSQVPEGVLERIFQAIEPFLPGVNAPVEAGPAYCPPSAPQGWIGWSAGASVLGGLLLSTLLALLPPDTPASVTYARIEPRPVTVAAPLESVETRTEPASFAVPPTASARAAAPPKREKRPNESMAYAWLYAAEKAAGRGDMSQARAELAVYDARYPKNPLAAARAKLARRIADLAEDKGATPSPR